MSGSTHSPKDFWDSSRRLSLSKVDKSAGTCSSCCCRLSEAALRLPVAPGPVSPPPSRAREALE
eukprot:5519058-Amphidinium_carterae.1